MNESPPTEYERYLRVPTLLDLQKPAAARSHEDELLFQVVHQVEELWFKVATDDAARATTAIAAGDDHAAVFLLGRISQLCELMKSQLALIAQMAPRNY